MLREDIEAFERALDAVNRQDVDAVVEECSPEVEWHPIAAAILAGEATVYRGREELRKGIQDLLDAFADLHFEALEFRDLGDEELVVIGKIRGHGTESGVEIDSPWAYWVQFQHGRALVVRGYLDPNEALEAAGLRE